MNLPTAFVVGLQMSHFSILFSQDAVLLVRIRYEQCKPIYRVGQKSKPQIFAHIFAKYWPIFQKKFHWHITFHKVVYRRS